MAAECDASGSCVQSGGAEPAGQLCSDTTPGDEFLAVCNGDGLCDQTGRAIPAPLLSWFAVAGLVGILLASGARLIGRG